MTARIAITVSALSRESLVDALRVLVFANLLWLRSESRAGRKPPPVYGSRVRFRPEPQAGNGIELYQTIPEVLAQGWGDCDDLAGWRVAELLVSGERGADVAILEQSPRVYHAVAVRSNGQVEDVAQNLRRIEVESWRR